MDRARVAALGVGWLFADPEELGITLHGIRVPRFSVGTVHDYQGARFNTRIEEYSFVADALADAPRGWVVDAGAGFNPEIHVLPEIVAEMGFDVVAVDASRQSLDMPEHPRITRIVADIGKLPRVSGGYQAWLCISVLEHLEPPQQLAAVREGWAVLRPGGLAIVTVDEMLPSYLADLLANGRFVTGDVQVPLGDTHLTSPRVSWAIAQKGG